MLDLRFYKNTNAQVIVKRLKIEAALRCRQINIIFIQKAVCEKMEKMKDFLIKLKTKFINFCKWVWQECKDWHTFVIFVIVVVIMYSPVWGGYLCHAVFGWKWCSVMATAYLAFWAGPFTPFFPLCIAITLGIRRIIDKIKGKDKTK